MYLHQHKPPCVLSMFPLSLLQKNTQTIHWFIHDQTKKQTLITSYFMNCTDGLHTVFNNKYAKKTLLRTQMSMYINVCCCDARYLPFHEGVPFK